MKKILLPVDGSEFCTKAYDMAKDFAKKFGAEIAVIHVENIESSFSYAYTTTNFQSIDAYIKEKSEEIIEKAKKHFEGEDFKVTFETTTGDPASEIIDYAEKENCDLILICTHGMSTTRRFLIGSVANKVVHHATVPVFVIR
ncbi:Nucleotide-binding universal stress protein, UspA family [Peptoclostridium litorale DSM 5388]|uniref:Universal stress protein n=1 Tax=Peptoclostridium litorale DSM 5388 TaxID=1121324 RepID=A0A069RQ06_PEPLI|nr:universal stress protein [Peptoclostridium litorale]KDR96267.1 hypothetical protein CLIT_4c01040 [Peptoclostridium litorale DSM 5388]SIO14819.1 Nucleotide-binding universal stress protein, UspA family [Peptoclostridium litorale DSM 5388]